MSSNQNVVDSLLKEISELEDLQKNHKKVNVVNAGLLKAGKSELFNAILGKEEFETGVIRTTIENKKIDLENYTLTDTPGLDANFDDNKMAFEGYKEADIIVFVHNAVDGELNKIEIDSIKEIIELFEDSKIFFDSSILAITHIDQLNNEEEEENILKTVNNQIKSVFGQEFLYVIGVDSISHMKGLKENKKLLTQSSNIYNLRLMIEEMIKEGNCCFYSVLNKLKANCNEKIEKVIETLRKEEKSIKIEDNSKNIQDVKIKIENIKNKSNSYSKNMPKENVQSISRGQLGRSQSYTRYKSSSSAKSAAESACREAIRNAASMARSIGSNMIILYEQQCSSCKDLSLKLMEDYNEIKKIYYSISSKNIPNLNFKLDEMSRDEREILKLCKDAVRYIEAETFRSPNSYFNAYSSNIYIEKDYEDEYVDGLFGGKWKQVAYYTWEIDGAVDDICDDYKEILEERTREPYELCAKVYKKNAEKVLKIYQTEVNKLISSLSSIGLSLSSENSNKNKQKEVILKNIELLSSKMFSK